ncbi:S-layer homology domain-containing protein [uncultured Oscillibacter sp.]|uniref:S-layer homology domain-containing protein n=1 Tax=uncultured Oscillibacter sp. TaxID=876091 RepID=UPI0028050066|nr:S-layer homology domain-containing protein [uncultured Oscillibacter sp.]
MKKFLSLVLALAMAMSLVTISAGAKDFTDDSKITYKEAVDVVSALDIVDGYTDGSFNPTNTLTRGAAAKIICNLILGPTTADALSADTAPFKDVPVTNEFAGYIAYCSQQGIISGYGDGTFRPAGTLTGYAFMKMLLGALGYDAEIEGYEGSNWSVAVAKQAVGIGLDDGNDEFVGVKAVTREEACLYAFNTLTADMVGYSQTTTVNVNGATVVVGGSKAGVVSNSESKDYRTDKDDQDEVMQFCEKYFTDLELRSDAAADVFGRPSNTWYDDNDKIGTYAKEADVVYTADVKAETIYKDLDLDKAYDYAVVIDGADANPFVVTKKDDTTVNGVTGDADDKINDANKDLVGNGSLIEVYKDEQTITVVNTYLMQVNGDYDEDEEELTLATVDDTKTPDFSYDDVISSDDFDNLDSYEDEEYVLVTIAEGEGIQSIAKAEQVTATVTEYVEDESVTAGGTEYKYAYANDKTEGSYDLKADYDLYLDAYGYVIYAPAVEDETNYVYIAEFAKDSNLSTNSKLVAYGYFLDGTDDEISVSKVDGDKVYGSDAGSLTAGEWYKFRAKDDGKYELTSCDESQSAGTYSDGDTVTNYDDQGVKIDLGNTTTKGNASTIFVVVKDNGDVKAYTGIKNVPDITADGDTVVEAYIDDGYAKYVFVDDAKSIVGGASSGDVVFLVDADKAGTDADDNSYYRYDAIVNGEEKTVKLDTVNDSLAGKLYTEIEYDENGYIVVDAMEAVNNATDPDKFSVDSANGVVTYKNGTLSIDGEGYYLASGAKIFVVEDGDVSTYTAKKLANEYDETNLKATIYGVMNADGEYTSIYVCL